MRDIAVTLAIFGSLPFVLKRPWIGILVWTWLGMMNPHRLAWGFSTTLPFAMVVALTTMLSMLMHRVEKRVPWERETVVLAIFVAWMTITTVFAIYPDLAWVQFDKVIKIQLMIFVAMMLINTPERIKYLVWTIALSLAFYGVKGGIFTITHGGVYRVQGPDSTFIAGNNELGLALAMTVPLLYFLARSTSHKLGRPLVYAATVLTAIGAIGSQSRGALLGMVVMGIMFWFKARNKFLTGILVLGAVASVAMIMPDEWHERMHTIATYQQDQSAMGRVNAWHMAYNLSSHRFFGGGFETFQWQMFALFAPDPDNVHDVHSIYFEILGEHGFVGLFLFLLLHFLTWRSASKLRRVPPPSPEWAFVPDLVTMLQASHIAYLTAGAFLGMAYFDLPYNLVLVVVAIKGAYRRLDEQKQAPVTTGVSEGSSHRLGAVVRSPV